jgi:ABC-type cobalamin transport system permease subunit
VITRIIIYNKHSRRGWKSMALVYVLTAIHLSGTDIVKLPHGLLTETGYLDVTNGSHVASLISTKGHGSMVENRMHLRSNHLVMARERNFHYHLSAVVTG